MICRVSNVIDTQGEGGSSVHLPVMSVKQKYKSDELSFGSPHTNGTPNMSNKKRKKKVGHNESVIFKIVTRNFPSKCCYCVRFFSVI